MPFYTPGNITVSLNEESPQDLNVDDKNTVYFFRPWLPMACPGCGYYSPNSQSLSSLEKHIWGAGGKIHKPPCPDFLKKFGFYSSSTVAISDDGTSYLRCKAINLGKSAHVNENKQMSEMHTQRMTSLGMKLTKRSDLELLSQEELEAYAQAIGNDKSKLEIFSKNMHKNSLK